MIRRSHRSLDRIARTACLLAASLVIGACKKGAAPDEPAPTAAAAEQAAEAESPAAADDNPTPAPVVKAESPTPPPAGDAPPTPAPPTPPPTDGPPPEAVLDTGTNPLPTQVAPGDIVRTTKARTPEHMIQQVLVAALEPDEDKGWRLFKSLLHADELHPNGLITRRSMNFAASRRKADLFIVEKADLPVFKVSRILEEGDGTLRFFVHNPESMPTPCTVRIDTSLNPPAWRIGLCSL